MATFGASDPTVNSDDFTNVFKIDFNGSVLNPIEVDLSSFLAPDVKTVATMYDDISAVTGGSGAGFNDFEVVTEDVGISGALKDYLDLTYGSGNWKATYTGFATAQSLASTGPVGSPSGVSPPGPDPTIGVDQPIININYIAAPGFQPIGGFQYLVLSNTSVPPVSGAPAQFGSYYYSCFEKNTLIATPNGDILVSQLKIGDMVLTQDGGAVEIKWIGYQAINSFFAKKHDSMPIKISAGALGENLPKNDLHVSPDHAFLIDGLLVNASALVNGENVYQVQSWTGNVEYYHIETEDHEIILAEGVPAETLLDNSGREKFANYKEFQELYPNGKVTKELDYPRVKFARQLPEQIKRKIANSAQGSTQIAA